MNKVIIDTDIGDDIDDAIAIALAVKSKEIDVLGITTVFRDVESRAKIAAQLLRSLGADHIPIAKGLCGPIIGEYSQINKPCQYEDYMNEEMYVSHDNAVDFMCDKINEYPNDITLVAIGPLTNIAALFIKEPSIIHKIKKLVIMGGAYFFHYSEWNIFQDVHASRVVFESGVDMEVFGLDVTLKCVIGVDDFASYCKNTELGFIAALIDSWNKTSELDGSMILHDPLVIASMLNSDMVTFVKRCVFIETQGEFTKGMTFVQETAFGWENYKMGHKIKIAKDVDTNRFFKLLMDTLA